MRKSTVNFQYVFKILGFLLIVESVFIAGSSIVSFSYDEDCAFPMLISAIITFLVGIIFNQIAGGNINRNVGKRESSLAVSFSWLALTFFGLLPYWISEVIPDFTDAFFETMSGFSATGSSIIQDIDEIPRGILFWRALTQWIGGVGIIIFVLVLMPMVGGSVSALYETETRGVVKERLKPKTIQVATRLIISYVVLTTICALALFGGPMSFFDSICHSMATVSTGGFSTKNESISFWHSNYIEYMTTLFMFLGGVNFTLIYFMLRGVFKKTIRDEEFRWYLSICIIYTIIITLGCIISGIYANVEEAFRVSLFSVVSIVTTTSFSLTNTFTWGTFYVAIFCSLMLFCACAGSTTGGLKITRLIVMMKNIINVFKKEIHPNAVLPVRINKTVVSHHMVNKVLIFILIYFSTIIISIVVMSLAGMNFEESVVVSLSSLGNVGNGIGRYGGSINSSYYFASDFIKWYISFLMLIGRLEIIALFSLMIPGFWRK